MTKEQIELIKKKVAAYKAVTGIQLDVNCHFDLEFVSSWYEKKYLTGLVGKWAMIKGSSITHYGDGVVYNPRNMTDEIAERLMSENAAYRNLFIEITETYK